MKKTKKKKPKETETVDTTVLHKNMPRSKEKYPALNTRRQTKIRQEYLDMDYVHKLNDKEKEWLNSFLEETVVTNFGHKGKKLYKNKRDKRKLYTENNTKNRCVYNIAKVTNMLFHTTNASLLNAAIDNEHAPTGSETEDLMIATIGIKKSGVIDE